jgi:asparagine synthase (glutamine-hydrolysing)
MCGISGIINFDRSKLVSKQELEKITNVIAHRGPDGFGYWNYKNIGFGHRRLSIIDIEGSLQPMSIENETFSITYNGEIYNFKELKKELLKLGYTFKTSGDTEVILRAYEHWGTKCLDKFRGMFSFAIADKVKREVFLARDHFGIKPMIYYTGNDYFMFGSEIQQFSEHKSFKKQVNVDALSEYLKYGYIPAPLTIYKNLHKLEPGNFIRVDFNGKIIEHKEYYDIDFQPDYSKSYSEWVEITENIINNSVDCHKIADVPYGAFLSGGIDSSLIASSLAEKGKNVDVFTMGFSNTDFNEVPYAKEVAKKYGLNHHIEYLNMEDMEDVFPRLVQHYGEPFADSSAIPTYYITKKIREYLPVVLSGDGGDEAFGGYYSYQNYLKIAKPHAPKHEYKNHIKSGLKYFGKTYKTTPRKPNLKDWVNLVSFNNENQNKLLFNPNTFKNIDNTNNIYSKWYQKAKSKNLDIYSTASYLDFKTYMNGDILTKVDIASMMNSLEVRTPLIDVNVVSLMAKIPSKHKISRNYDGTWSKKKILNSIAEKRLGEQFVKRKKQGFSIPLKDWFGENTNFGNNFSQIINNDNSEIFKYLQKDTIINQFNKGKETNYSQLYLLFSLETWLKSI